MITPQTETSLNRNRMPSLSRLIGTRLWESPLLSGEERRALEDAVSLSSSRSIQAGTNLIRENDRADCLFVVCSGWACRYSLTSDGGRQISALLLPGDVANLDTLMFDRLDYGICAMGDASVVALPRERALALAAEHRGIAQTFTRLALIENSIFGKWALSLGRRMAKQRLAHLLCELSLRLNAEEGNESRFDYPLTQEQVADTLGLTPVHVNRTMQQLRAEGLIVTRHKTMVLPDVARLRGISNFEPHYLHIDQPPSAHPAGGEIRRQAA